MGAGIAVEPPRAAALSRERVETGSINLPVGKFPKTLEDVSSLDARLVSDNLVRNFNDALFRLDYRRIGLLFLEGGYWRDHLAICWDLHTLKGRENISKYLTTGNRLLSLEIDESSAFRAPRIGPLDGVGDSEGIQFFIRFSTITGSGRGVVRLVYSAGAWQILSLFTALQTLIGCEEPLGSHRPRGSDHQTTPGAQNWQDKRNAQQNFTERDPTVLIIGNL
jgi:hypothetical protein